MTKSARRQQLRDHTPRPVTTAEVPAGIALDKLKAMCVARAAAIIAHAVSQMTPSQLAAARIVVPAA